MTNEGSVVGDSKIVIKSEMVKALRKLGRCDVHTWEKAVFERLTGTRHEEIDWEAEDNQAGYHSWLRSFDGLITELVDDGYVKMEAPHGEGARLRIAVPLDVD